jgi:ABC transporter transmembrane region
MLDRKELSLVTLFQVFRWKIGLTWTLTILETGLMALIPLFIGLAIDGLMTRAFEPLYILCGVLAALLIVATGRRVYDTRAYGTIRVALAAEMATRNSTLKISSLSARVHMARELVDFLEGELPAIMTSVLQLVVAVGVLAYFDWVLAASALSAGGLMLVIYGLFHRRFFRLNRALNAQAEKEVSLLERRDPSVFLRHLRSLRRFGVQLSDTEAAVYSIIFALLLSVVVFNLGYTALVIAASAGAVFSIITYSWDFVDGAVSVPMALQSWSRLSEIIERINKTT